MKKSTHDFLWPSFTDLMMSLFFIMLVLYVLTYLFMKNEQMASAEQLQRIREVQHAVNELDTRYFTYDSAYKRFTLNRQISFPRQQSTITNPSDRQYLLSVGVSIQNLIVKLKRKYAGQNISYMVVIEGMASQDNYDRNFQLSYERSLALYSLWKSAGIRLDASTCELQIAGSGTAGLGRSRNEAQNQRFLIQIIPKIGTLQ
jgi:hypothetical protein